MPHIRLTPIHPRRQAASTAYGFLETIHAYYSYALCYILRRSSCSKDARLVEVLIPTPHCLLVLVGYFFPSGPSVFVLA